jgi:hypothetical protein
VGEGGAERSEAPGEGSAFITLKECEKAFGNSFWVQQHIVVPIARDGKPFTRQDGIASSIASRIQVLAAVDFDNDAWLKANKIQNVTSEWDLPPKLKTREAPVPEQPPHRDFRIRLLSAQ